jgi:tagatose 1,6-diphosphate aldolase
MTSIGKYRHLLQASTPAGHFCILAIDHRANLKSALEKHAAAPVDDAAFTAFKQQIMRHLLPGASAVLTDPAFGIGTGIASSIISGQVGLLAPLEVTNYDLHPRARLTQFIEHWSVAQIKRSGGSGIKLLLYYHPADSLATEKQALVSRIVEQCAAWDIPFYLEPIAYSLDPQKPLENAELRQVVVQSALIFSKLGVDVLKLEFPLHVQQEPDEAVWAAACREVTAACGDVPWTLLSAGVDYATFQRQARIACQQGASGVIVGRAVWNEAVSLQGDAREVFLAGEGRSRITALQALCAEYATDWRTRVTPPVHGPDWYVDYARPGSGSSG